ncbi:MAG: U32 family peptidase [Defluviitaleaceae bacterium]|nr:U32 family peptidase [Defluviitaleaceae bacterium]
MNNETRKKPEVLAPAGDFEKLQFAVAYGADAVYIGGTNFSLRANAKNFDTDQLQKAINYAHNKNVKVYVAVNIFAHNADFEGLEGYFATLKKIGADAVIVADLGVFDIARKIKGLEIHISTQANTTNYQTALLYKSLGASRVVLARELSFAEITEINEKLRDKMETEVFAHGAMCMAYSGRCLLSNYMTGRDANKGDCAQSCRWQYSISEPKRPGEQMPVYQDERGTYIMNSKDLCMVEYIPELVACGTSSLKIEGRMKSAYYVAVTTNIYRQALDDFFVSPDLYNSKKAYYVDELKKTKNREFFTGFYFGKPTEGQVQGGTSDKVTQEFVGVVLNYNEETGFATIEQRNKFNKGERVEFIKGGFCQVIEEIYTEKGDKVESAPHPQQILQIKVCRPVAQFDIMRLKT